MPRSRVSAAARQSPRFERPPFPGAIGQRIVEQICQDCWGLWLRQQTMLINHYGLNVMDPQARSFLKQNMQALPLQVGRRRGRRHVEEGNDSVVSSWRARAYSLGRRPRRSLRSARAPTGGRESIRGGPSPSRGAGWADSVLATLSPRDKAAQLVWPQLFGDYTPTSSAGWTRVEQLIAHEHVGGFIMSIGSPIETAVKLNAMQRLSRLPLVIGADYETGVAYASARRLLPAEQHLSRRRRRCSRTRWDSARRATRRSPISKGAITAIEGRALGVHIAFAPVLDVNNNPANPVIGVRSFGEDPHLVADMGAALHSRPAGARDDRHRKALSRVTATPTRIRTSRSRPCTRVARASTPWSSSRSERAIAAGVQGIMTFHGVVPGARHRVRSRDAQSGDHDGAAAQAARLQGTAHHRRDGHERRPRARHRCQAAHAGPTRDGQLRHDRQQH